MKRVFLMMIILGFWVPHGYCDTSSDLKKLSSECIEAYNTFISGLPPKYFEKEAKQSYIGLSGDQGYFYCKYPIVLNLKFYRNIINGEYYYIKNKSKIIHVRGVLDSKGQLALEEILDSGQVNYKFRGIFKNGKIKGLWSKGEGKKQFAFFAEEK